MILIDSICKKNNIKDKFVRKDTKFNNNRLFIGCYYVIKLYPREKEKYFFNEISMYKKLDNKKFLPKLINYGEVDGVKYIIITKIDAIPIYEVWNDCNEIERKNIIMQISNIIKGINDISFFNGKVNFKTAIKDEYDNNIRDIDIDYNLLMQINKFSEEVFRLIDYNEKMMTIYSDFHFNNFLIDKNKNVYVVDFESISIGPIDYQIASISRQCVNPEIEAEEYIIIKKNDYKKILKYFYKYYRSMFDNSNWDKRVKLYNIIYHLKAVKNKKASSQILIDELERNYLYGNL